MLAVIAASGERGISRDRFVTMFWPESDDERARQSARQALYGLRQELGHEVVRTPGRLLALDPATIDSDVSAFKSAVAAGDRARAIAIEGGAFLEGFMLAGAPGFQRWADEERDRIAGMRTTALIGLAADATRTGRVDEAVEWWRRLTEADPLNGRIAVGYLKALATRGDRAAALAFARKHETVIRRELEVEPDPEVQRIEAELRAMPAAISTPTGARVVAPDDSPRDANDVPSSIAHGTASGSRSSKTWALGRVQAASMTLAVAAVAVAVLSRDRIARADAPPVFAVGLVRAAGAADSTRAELVFTDMLATNLARVDGLHVVPNARMLALLRSGSDTAAAYAEAARRAGASELLEGRLLAQPGGLALELQRVELHSGVLRDAFTVRAANRMLLVDSATALLARRFRLPSPPSSIGSATTASAIAYRLYEEGLRAYLQDDLTSARRLMRSALGEDSTFAMAAYYEALLAAAVGDRTPDGRHAAVARRVALRLAARAPERERLLITANVLGDDMDPAAVAVAESLAVRYPEDPSSHLALGHVLCTLGDWSGSVQAIERAIALDERSEPSSGTCRLCDHLNLLGWVYLWADSLDAAVRTAHRQLAIRPDGRAPLYALAVAHARRGDSTSAYQLYRQLMAHNSVDRAWKLIMDLRLEQYETFEATLPQLLWSTTPIDGTNARWYQLISLRNQGRLREAAVFHQNGRLSSAPERAFQGEPDRYNAALLAMARGEGREAARIFEETPPPDTTIFAEGHIWRHRAWYGTLAGMAWAAAGDTARVRRLADSVEQWGRRSLFGRDRQLHHYLRGMLELSAGRDEAAVPEFRQAIVSPTLGFTRVNYELGSVLLRLGRPREAVAALQPALRGELDAANLYITRTELHERLAEAFDRAGERDSAAVHYAAVARAWQRADPAFQVRRERAVQRLGVLTARQVATSPARRR